MKKFLSKVLTLALVGTIVITGTSITSEAKGSKKATSATYSTNAIVNDFVATGIKSNGLTIGGKSYNSQQALTLGFAADPAVTVSPLYYQEDFPAARCSGFYLYADGAKGVVDSKAELIFDSDTSTNEMNDAKAGFILFSNDAIINTDGVWNTDAFIANDINTQYACAWMQSRGLNTATDVYNYFVANGVTFTEHDTGDSVSRSFVCNQCPELGYTVVEEKGYTYAEFGFYYDNLSGVNEFGINSYTKNGCTTTRCASSVSHYPH